MVVGPTSVRHWAAWEWANVVALAILRYLLCGMLGMGRGMYPNTRNNPAQATKIWLYLMGESIPPLVGEGGH